MCHVGVLCYSRSLLPLERWFSFTKMCLTIPDVCREGIRFVYASFGDTFLVTENFLCMFESVLFQCSGGVLFEMATNGGRTSMCAVDG